MNKNKLIEIVKVAKKEDKANLMIMLEILDDTNNRQIFTTIFKNEIDEEVKKIEIEHEQSNNGFNGFINIERQAIRNICKKFINEVKIEEVEKESSQKKVINFIEQLKKEKRANLCYLTPTGKTKKFVVWECKSQLGNKTCINVYYPVVIRGEMIKCKSFENYKVFKKWLNKKDLV